jgi:hypothetical protein
VPLALGFVDDSSYFLSMERKIVSAYFFLRSQPQRSDREYTCAKNLNVNTICVLHFSLPKAFS